MNRLNDCFARLAAARRKGLVTFITAGDPELAATPAYMHALVRGGADIIELGVPFSDPMADGPVIQRSSERALAAGTTPDDVLACVQRFRAHDQTTPVVLMGYLNPFEHRGPAAFAGRAAAAGADGVLVVDLPPEEAHDFHAALAAAGLAQIFLVAPTSSTRRIEKICAMATGFVYFVSIKGVTGGKSLELGDIEARIRETRALSPLPVGVGFGIRTPAAAAAAAGLADAVIVGSALVELIERGGADCAERLTRYVAELRTAIDDRVDAA